MLDSAALPRALRLLGDVLQDRGLSYELVAAGGSALLLLGLRQRPTRDLDVVAWLRADVTSQPILCPPSCSTPFGTLGKPWGLVMTGSIRGRRLCSSSACQGGFAERVQTMRFGQLTLHLASRSDQICFKVYAATDQGPDSKHFDDLNTLAPSGNELIEAARWARTHDPSDGFRGELIALLRVMGMTDAAQVV